MARRPSSPRRRQSRLTPRRWLPLLALIAVAVLAVVALPDPIRPDAAQARADRAATLVPSGAVDQAISSAWFCGGGSALGPKGPAELVVVIANVGDAKATATVTVVNDSGRRAVRRVSLPAHGARRVQASAVRSGRWVAATVEVLGGTPVVSREVTGPQGIDAAPCASTAGDVWHVASGSTVRGATEVLSIYNPFPDSATVDLAFATESGPRQPRDLQGLSVPGGTLKIVAVNQTVTNRERVAATVRARFGRVVVDRVQRYDGTGEAPAGSSDGSDATTGPDDTTTTTAPADGSTPTTAAQPTAPDATTPEPTPATAPADGAPATTVTETPATVANLRSGDAPTDEPTDEPAGDAPTEDRSPAAGPVGLVSTPATPGSAPRWLFPGTDAANAVAGQVAIYNPGEEPAEVDVVLTYEEPGRNPPIEPIQLTVAPRQVQLTDLAEAGGLEAEVAFSVDVRSLQGVGIVADLLDTSVVGAGADAIAGAAVTQGAPVGATRWLVADVTASDTVATSAIVANPGRSAVRVTVVEDHDGSSRPLSKATISVPAGDRRTIDLSDATPGSALTVRASSPVVVTTGFDALSGLGRSTSLAQPAPSTVEPLPDPT